MFDTIVSRTHRVPTLAFSTGNAHAKTRQLDATLLSVGFKLSTDLFNYLANQTDSVVSDIANRLIPIVNKMIGNHVKHKVYFRNFPNNVPDTEEFWMSCVYDAIGLSKKEIKNLKNGSINLVNLPTYGQYLYSYEDMVSHHEEFVPSIKDKVKILHLGNSLSEEVNGLYHQLAGSSVPLNEDDRKLIRTLAKICIDDSQPTTFPVRENKAIVNAVRAEHARPLMVDTVTDVLRLACVLSDGDVSLIEKTKFKSFSRKIRRILFSSLSDVLLNSEAKMLDGLKYIEPWKRLGEKLHPHESNLPMIREFFAVIRGDQYLCSNIGQIEILIAGKKFSKAIDLLISMPGVFFRYLDRMIRLCQDDTKLVEKLVAKTSDLVEKVSGRVIFSVWEHFLNRTVAASKRIFANSKGKTWVQDETRSNLDPDVVNNLVNIIRNELRFRYLKMGIDGFDIEPEMLSVTLPLSEKNKSSGFGIMPKGSVIPVNGEQLRFFMYWKQKSERTDYDLSVFFVDNNFKNAGHCSWTNLKYGDVVHSGDIISAPNGASEFIDIKLNKVRYPYIVAQVNRYAGENFQSVQENLFGFMNLSEDQKGKPFEARTVKVKAEIRGNGQVAIPALFFIENDNWYCKWLDYQLTGQPNMNTVEGNKLTTAMLIEAEMKRKRITLQDLKDLFVNKSCNSMKVCFQKSDDIPLDQKVITLNNLTDLIPQ